MSRRGNSPDAGTSKKKDKKPLSDRIKMVLLIVVIAIAFVIFISVLSRSEERRSTVYSSYSEEKSGALALYYAMEEAGKQQDFTVSRYAKPARFLEEPSIVICISAQGTYLSDAYEIENIEQKIESGSVFIFADQFYSVKTWAFPDKGSYAAEYYHESDYTYPWSFYKAAGDEGCLVCYLGNPDWTNGSLLANRDFGVDLLLLVSKISEQTGIKNVVFDEYYLGIEEGYTADILSYGVFLCLAELCVAVILLMLSLAKRFGAPRTEYSTVKRDENENVYAVASLYKRTKSYDVVFDIYMELLLADAARVLGVTGDTRFQYDTILAMMKDSPLEKKYPALKTLAETYRRPKRKIGNKKDLKKKLTLIEELRRKLSDG